MDGGGSGHPPAGAAKQEQAACLVLIGIRPGTRLGPDCCGGWGGAQGLPVCLVYVGEVEDAVLGRQI